MRFNPLIPELTCADFRRSLAFYVDLLGFRIVYERPEENFVFLEREGAQIMLEQENENWLTGPVEHPYGRGLNLQIETTDTDTLCQRLQNAGHPIFVPIEEKWYRADDRLVGLRQFLVQDPDGYLLRFAQGLGERPVP